MWLGREAAGDLTTRCAASNTAFKASGLLADDDLVLRGLKLTRSGSPPTAARRPCQHGLGRAHAPPLLPLTVHPGPRPRGRVLHPRSHFNGPQGSARLPGRDPQSRPKDRRPRANPKFRPRGRRPPGGLLESPARPEGAALPGRSQFGPALLAIMQPMTRSLGAGE
jgi:hypothetical protein